MKSKLGHITEFSSRSLSHCPQRSLVLDLLTRLPINFLSGYWFVEERWALWGAGKQPLRNPVDLPELRFKAQAQQTLTNPPVVVPVTTGACLGPYPPEIYTREKAHSVHRVLRFLLRPQYWEQVLYVG